MPMIDVYAMPDTFADKATLATKLAATLMTVEAVATIAIIRENTAASSCVRIQVITNKDALDRIKQQEAVRRLTQVVMPSGTHPWLSARGSS